MYVLHFLFLLIPFPPSYSSFPLSFISWEYEVKIEQKENISLSNVELGNLLLTTIGDGGRGVGKGWVGGEEG